MTTIRTSPRALALGAVLVIVAAACSTPAASGGAGATAGAGGNMDKLIADAKAEGAVNVIALPHDWCNYGAMIEGFKAKYPGITVNENLPDGGSGDEIEAIKNTQGQTGPAVPDVIDVGIAFGEQIKTEKLVQAYKVATFDSIDPDFKDPDGFWYGDYYSILTFEVNKSAATAPADWADLLKADYANKVALAGDPRVSSQAYNAVWAAALANGGSLDNAQPGLDFFKQLNDAGNFVPTIAKPGTIDQGATPVTIRWAYNALAHKDTAAGNPEIEVVVPKTGRFIGVYAQAISAYAPHPNAAKLWMEYLYSDEGQAHWLTGYCATTRLDDLKAKGLHADLIAKLPDTTGGVFPTNAQSAAAKELITTKWDSVVGVDVAE